MDTPELIKRYIQMPERVAVLSIDKSVLLAVATISRVLIVGSVFVSKNYTGIASLQRPNM